MTIKLYQMIK